METRTSTYLQGFKEVEDMQQKSESAARSDTAVATRLVHFKFDRPDNPNENKPISGDLELVYHTERATFFLRPLSALDELSNVAHINAKFSLRTPFLLGVHLLSSTFPPASKPQEYLVIGYDKFEDTFPNWIATNPVPPFSAVEGPLDDWWMKQIVNLLNTLAYLHKKKVFHGRMADDSNYVILDGMIHLINASVDGSLEKEERKLEVLAQNDINGLKAFLIKHVVPNFISTDWNNFIGLFDVATIPQLKNHPILMDHITRFKYFRHIGLFLKSQLPPRDQHFINGAMDNSLANSFADWDRKIPQGSVFWDVFTHGNPYYPDYNPHRLWEFVIKILYHYDERARARPNFQQFLRCRGELEEEISSLYPGLLSLIHEMLVREFGQFSISSERPHSKSRE